jgi:hypothetical protein
MHTSYTHTPSCIIPSPHTIPCIRIHVLLPYTPIQCIPPYTYTIHTLCIPLILICTYTSHELLYRYTSYVLMTAHHAYDYCIILSYGCSHDIRSLLMHHLYAYTYRYLSCALTHTLASRSHTYTLLLSYRYTCSYSYIPIHAIL